MCSILQAETYINYEKLFYNCLIGYQCFHFLFYIIFVVWCYDYIYSICYPNDSRSTGRRESDQIPEVSIQCYENSVGFDGKPSYLPNCFPGQACSSRI